MSRSTLRPTIVLVAVLTLFVANELSAADVDFAKQIQPLFMEHCAGCHGEKKGLGKLRLHSPEAIQKKWGADRHLITKGAPDESELYERLVLPADHKKFMPKKGKPLSAEELTLIHDWIQQGAAFVVSSSGEAANESVESHDDSHDHPMAAEAKEIPLPEVDAADSATIEKLADTGAQVTPLYAGSPLLQVSFALRGEPATDAEIALLGEVAEQVYSLNLAKAQITNQSLIVLSQLKNLSKLHLEKSSVQDSSLTHLSGLTNLQYLNLYGTQISDEGLRSLAGLKHLRKLYVWQTKVSYDAAQALEKARPGLAVDLGFDHPVVMRKRLTRQLEQAKENSEESETAFEKAKANFERAKQDREKLKKHLEDLQKQLDKLDGKADTTEPEVKADEQSADADNNA